ncbi:MAG: hypothetical protein JWM35_1046 [Verrucomicrobia bacterium]|nr:hypothetical protein [Verrucomicrobiota bacterium]
MDNELHELEAELTRLRPIAPSEMLTARIERDLGVRRSNRWAWAALPLAAALALAVFLRDRAVETVAPPVIAAATKVAPTFKPVSAKNMLYEHRDDGLVTLADGTTARRFRNSYVDTITWKDPRTQASLRWSVPRTEDRVVPVTFQ